MQTVQTQISIPMEMLMEALKGIVPVDRHQAMVERHGEACTKAEAARIISCSFPTINALINDGRIKSACEGTRVDVRSIADYIERRADIDHETRLNKKRRCR